jgi:murein DD-endopeptidase MepM/ murein hydrolase activator NlpD
MVAGLPEIAPDVRKVGVGGQGYDDLPGPPASLQGQSTSPGLLLADLDQLLRLVKLEKRSFQDVEATLQSNRERLEHTPSIQPAEGYISRGFGSCTDPFTGGPGFHEGIDIVNQVGTSVRATAAGKVTERGWRKGYGWVVVIDHGYGYETAYGHLDAIEVTRGQRVNRGQVIATLGNSGRSTGPHLHYEVRVEGKTVNPLRYVLPEVVVD